METEVLVQAERLTRYYDRNCAVRNVSFQLNKGDVLGFLGPNGAGKSTTMQMITGNLAPSAGKVSIEGEDLLDSPKKAKGNIGYLPETPPCIATIPSTSSSTIAPGCTGFRATGSAGQSARHRNAAVWTPCATG